MQDNRQIEGNAALDDVDHALGRPYRLRDSRRDHYATDCPDQKREMSLSPWWNEGVTRDDMTYFHVSEAGRHALEAELSNTEKYGRLYEITSPHYSGSKLINAKSASQAKYRAWIDADIDWSFIDYSTNVRARLAR